ncbi:hypothetical protein MKZ38_008599 [Zalerion maritima]|uniref:Uncharacterized protein n=1 Tax=Zalerion maritima TaxID=339359 RepID=A0AAD5RYD8_9PEZI|nr:hypothetical protein MKZ38_008599 [Zalerion maritima]
MTGRPGPPSGIAAPNNPYQPLAQPQQSQSQLQEPRSPLAPPAQVTPIPVPQPRSQIQPTQQLVQYQPKPPKPSSSSSHHLQQPQSQKAQHASPPEQRQAPARPPVSPLTPPPPSKAKPAKSCPRDFAQDRPVLTHSQPPQTGIPPPPPVAIDLESNPDAIALRGAISILQNQRNRAIRDIQTLQQAKNDAIERPETFLADFQSGRVKISNSHTGISELSQSHESSDISSDSSSDEDAPAESSQAGLEKLRRRQERSRRRAEMAAKKAAEPSWTKLPAPQNVVRCPPINWTKYAVVGESFDKLHAQQVDRPPNGAPATLGPNGVYEFRGGDGTDVSAQKYIGVATPYTPGRDQINRKPKGKR